MKRLFFGFELISPWPAALPEGRFLQEKERHLTVGFLGDTPFEELKNELDSIPPPPFTIGLAALFDAPLFLPEKSPRVAAWHVSWLEKEQEFLAYQRELVAWLREKKFKRHENHGTFLSHVTLARQPFAMDEWKERFEKSPLFICNLHLYESIGSLRYKSCWTYPLLAPFEEIEHTGDIAFIIRGASFLELHLHAQLALSFHFPPLVDFFSFAEVHSLDEIVQSLNHIIGRIDQEMGSPFKAVSYHGTLKNNEWEMIVDV